MTSPAFAVSKNVEHVKTLPEGKWATAINFLNYGGQDVMMVTGRFGLKSYSLADPANPRLLDEITSQELQLPGDPPTDFTVTEPGGDPKSTFWQNEDMDVDQARKLVLISRDPRSYRGSTSREPGEADPNGATNIAGVYVVDAKNPADLKLLTFQQLPTGHTTTCINDCQWLWTGGPAATTTQQQAPLNWAGGRPLIVTDLRDPAHPVAPSDGADRPVPPGRRHRLLARRPGRRHGHRVGLRRRRHARLLDRRHGTATRSPASKREATPLNPIPYAGGGFAESETNDDDGGFEHNAERPVGRNAPRAYRSGKYLLATEEDFADPSSAAASRATSTSPRSTAATTARRGARRPAQVPAEDGRLVGAVPAGGLAPGRRAVRAGLRVLLGALLRRERRTVAYAWYGEGTRFLDISDPRHPKQIAYWRPDDTLVWASYFRGRYVYTADHVRGIDVLRLTPGAHAARSAKPRCRRSRCRPSSSASWRGWRRTTGPIPPRAGSAC